MYDAIVVGARCAGAATAMLLARLGNRVLLVDRSRFPSDTMSSLYIHQPGIALLAKWGLHDTVADSGAPKLDKVVYGVPGLDIRGAAPTYQGIDGTYAPRRVILDQILVDAARSAGAEFRDGTKAVGLLHDADRRVAGVRLRTLSGVETKERAHIVIGADGMRSSVAGLAGAAAEHSDPLMTCVYYGMWRDLPAEFEFYERPGNWISVVPTNDALTVVSAYFPQRQFPLIRTDTRAWFDQAVRLTSPDVHKRMLQARQVERLQGTGDQQNFLRQAYGPGWALVGDAGTHKDTITARGITDAFLQADMLAAAIGDVLQHPELLDAALARYARRRDTALGEPYRNTLALAKLDLSQNRTKMLTAISESPMLTQLYLSVIAGIKTMDDLLVPELLERL